jgi:hypothetical protein
MVVVTYAQPTVDYGLSTDLDTSDPAQPRYIVTVILRSPDNDTNIGLGQADFYLNYNTAGLSFDDSPSYNTDWQLAPDIEANTDCYSNSAVSDQEAQGRLYVSIDYNYTGFACGVDQGSNLTSSYQEVVTLFLDVIDETQTAELSFAASITNTFGDDSSTEPTRFANGSFMSDNGVLPVELVEFTAQADGEAVQLRWATASETNNAGFEVQMHAVAPEADRIRWQPQGWVDGWGTTAEPQQYAYRMDGVAPGTHRLRLKQVDFDGTFAFSPEVEVTVGLDAAYRLTAPYPNPFNPEARFSLMVRRAQHVEVAVYDALGRRVRVLHDGPFAAGTAQAFVVEGHGLQSGVYFIRAVGETFVATQQATLVK